MQDRPSGAERSEPGHAPLARLVSVVTRMTFAALPSEVWNALMFYEDIDQSPPLHLRLLLPHPIRNEGRISKVGDQVTCRYERGHLLKRIMGIEVGRSYDFDIVEQSLVFGGGLRLAGGRYELRESAAGQTEVSVETRYRNARSPRFFWEALERIVCHSFHRHLLSAIGMKVDLSRRVPCPS